MIFHGKNCDANAAQYDITNALSVLYFIPHLRPGLPSCLTFNLTHQKHVCKSRLHHACLTPRPSHPSWCYHPKNIWRKIQVIGHEGNNHAISFTPYYSTHLRAQYLCSLSNMHDFKNVLYGCRLWTTSNSTKLHMNWYDIFNCNWVVTRWQQYSTHIYTNNTENDTKQTIHTTTQKLGRVRAVPRLCGFYPGICLTTEEKARKNLSAKIRFEQREQQHVPRSG
jgi:hypothetical protein